MKVTVDTIKYSSSGTEHAAKKIDWSDSSDRRWLMNHLHHCMMNDKQVILSPADNQDYAYTPDSN